jgi:ribose/xylose/arabinose/galactoside ABC-type transport system permease subunit
LAKWQFRTSNKWKFTVTSELMLLLAYLVMLAVFSILAPHFFEISNFLNIGLYSSIVGVSAVGMTFVLLTGNIDISVGSIMAVVGVAMAVMLQDKLPLLLVIAAGLVLGLVIGLINGLLVTKIRINSLIVTLATMAIFEGLAYVLCGGLAIVITSQSFSWLGTGYILGIPASLLLMVVLYIAFDYVAKNTKFGRRVYASGGNPRASYLSGINVNRTIIDVFMLSGLTAAVGGLIIASQTGAGLPSAGSGSELQVIAAAVLGGTSLSGGKGKLVGTLIGVLIMATLSNGLVLMNVPSFYQEIAMGLVLLVAVLSDRVRRWNAEE